MNASAAPDQQIANVLATKFDFDALFKFWAMEALVGRVGRLFQ